MRGHSTPCQDRSHESTRSGQVLLSSRALSIRLVRDVVSRLHEHWERLPTAARRRWWATLTAGMGAVFGLTVGLVVGVRALAESGALEWEPDALLWVARDLPLSFSFGMGLEAPGNGLVLWAIVLFAAGVAAWRERPLRSIAIVLGHTLAYLPVGLGWWLWDRPRPDLVMQGVASPQGLLRSFPSGHMVQTSFAYGILMWLWWRSSPSRGERAAAVASYVLLVAAVALGRLRVGSHWPSDVAAGIVIGVACTAAVAVALHRGEAAVEPAGDRPRVD